MNTNYDSSINPSRMLLKVRASMPLTSGILCTLEEAEKLAWMSGKGNKEATRTMLATRNADGLIPVTFGDEDDEEGFFEVWDDGRGHFLGTQDDIDEAKREAEKEAKADAERQAHPDLEWLTTCGEIVKVWYEGDDVVEVLYKGQKLSGLLMPVPTSNRQQAQCQDIVAVIGTHQGKFGLTAERKAKLLAATQ